MLNPPTSVDSLPRLRRFTSSQCQQSSFAYLGHEEKPREKKDGNKEAAAQEMAGTSQLNQENEGEDEDEQNQTVWARSKGEDKQRRSAEVLQQPLPKNKRPNSSRVKAEDQDKRDLVEVPLSALKPPEGFSSGQEMEGEEDGDGGGDDQKMCCGFFFKVTKTLKMITVVPRLSCSDPCYHGYILKTPRDKRNLQSSDPLIFPYSNTCYALIMAWSYVISFLASCQEPHNTDSAGGKLPKGRDRSGWRHTTPGVNPPLMIHHPIKYSTLYKKKST